MAIELPGEVVTSPQFIGVNWPQVNEVSERAFAGHVRDFAWAHLSQGHTQTFSGNKVGLSFT